MRLINNKLGMTLIEVMVAVAIFCLLFIPITGFFYSANHRAQNTVIERQALAVAEARLEILRNEGYKGLLLREFDADVVREETQGKFNIRIDAAYDTTVNMTHIIVTVSCKGRQVSLSTLASKHRR